MSLARDRRIRLGPGLGFSVGLALAMATVNPVLRPASAQSLVVELESESKSESASESTSPAPAASPPGTIRFVGRNLIATARGVFHRWRIREHRLDPARLEQAFAVVEVDLASVDTDNERRDTHLRHPDFFGVETHPNATVRVHSARQTGTSAEGHPLYEVRFDVDLHDVTKTLRGEIELVAGTEPDATEMVFEGRLTIDRMEFGIGPPPSRWNPLAIDREIPVSFRAALPIVSQPAQSDPGS